MKTGIIFGAATIFVSLTVVSPVFATVAHPTDPHGFVTDGSPQNDDLHCVGTNRQIGQCMAARWNWTGAFWACLDHRITDIENRIWNPTLYNTAGSGAYGIPQALPGNKMAGPNYVEIPGGGYRGDWRTDPYIQIAWLRVYVRDRYGNPCNIPSGGSY